MNARADPAMSGRLTMRARMLVGIVPVAVLSIVAIAYQAERIVERTVRDQGIHRVEAARETARTAVERYLDGIDAAMHQIAGDSRTAVALQELSQAVRQLEDDPQTEPRAMQSDLRRLQARLERYYGPLLTARQIDLHDALLVDRSALWLQAHYAAREPSGTAEDEASADLTAFGVAHAEWHPVFAGLAAQHSLADLLLIRAGDGRIVYSVAKRPDFQTSLIDGPYARSHLAALFRRIRSHPEAGRVELADFEAYLPGQGQPAAFEATPFFADGMLVGVVVAQITAQAVSRIVSAGGRWEDIGLGADGDVFLVGSDGVLRSEPRWQARAAKSPRGESAPAGAARLATALEASGALGRHEFTDEYVDSRGVPVLGAVGPLTRRGVQWGVVASVSQQELLRPLAVLRRQVAAGALGLAALLALVVWAAASWALHPLRGLTAALHALRAGDPAARIESAAPGECSALARGVNGLLEQTATRAAEERRRRAAYVGDLVGAVTALGDADWSQRAEVTGELADLAAAVNAANARIQERIERLRAVPGDIAASAESLHAAVDHLRREAARHTRAVTAAEAAAEGAVATQGALAERVTEANAAVHGALDAARAGADGSRGVVADVEGLRARVEQGGATLRRLAEQCVDVSLAAAAVSRLSSDLNLLALNAAIEAARGDEPHARVSLTADEARRLADRADGLRHEIAVAVETLQIAANEAMAAVERQSDAVDRHAATAAAVPDQLACVCAAVERGAARLAELTGAAQPDGEQRRDWRAALNPLQSGAQRLCRAAEIAAREAAALFEAIGERRVESARPAGEPNGASDEEPEGAAPARVARS